MSLILYDRSTGEIRVRLFDEDGDAITNGTATCTLYNGASRPEVVFADRAMAYDAAHPFTNPGDLGCYFCTASSVEMNGPQGAWKATITAADSLGRTLTLDAYISVSPFVVS